MRAIYTMQCIFYVQCILFIQQITKKIEKFVLLFGDLTIIQQTKRLILSQSTVTEVIFVYNICLIGIKLFTFLSSY